MKKLLIFILTVSFAFAAQIEVTADKFGADEKKQISEFAGNVTVIKEKDTLNADKVTINFDERKQPTKYTASGNVRVKMLLNEKHYNASGKTLIYEPALSKYTLEGDAFLSEIDTDKRVYGEKIEVDQTNGTYVVEGKSSEPAKFFFQIEDSKK
ncbi:MAG: lipopolysaccharide transport periplasmic protein LptA [Campylobacteraceae bacterium]|jgi:lipopolysaccharide export system protein LptA|nr:lipopolysaccharide transport periplasmic protein LptA [Campylobacteraceae bacterium]